MILEPVVQAQGLVGNNLLASKEAIGPYTVVEIDHDHAVVGSCNEVCTIVVCIAVGIEAAALDEDVDGEFAVACRFRRRKHVDKQAILGMVSTELGIKLGSGADAERSKLGTD